MSMQPTLYLMLGYPGAGKTATAKVLRKLTGAQHIWADHERRKKLDPPSYSESENEALYQSLNKQAIDLLSSGTSVVYDTAFNHYSDRQKLRTLAKQAGATTKLLWLQVPKETARVRAVEAKEPSHNRRLGNMSHEDFERLSTKLELPHDDEEPVCLDGTKITAEYVAYKLGL